MENFQATTPTYPMGDTGYTRNNFHSQPTILLTVNYYDSYSFLNLCPTNTKASLTYAAQSEYDIKYTVDKSMLTGKRIYYNNGTAYLTHAYYYNWQGKLIQALSTNHLNGMEKEHFSYTYTNNVSRKTHTHTANGKNYTQLYAYSYDHADRLKKTTHELRIDGISKGVITLAEYEYIAYFGDTRPVISVIPAQSFLL